MIFNKLDLENWERRDVFNHFTTIAKSSYSLTVNIDVTKLLSYIKRNNLRFYPTFTWIVTKAINNQLEFKMGFDEKKNLGYYDVIYPAYAVFNEKTKIADSLCTEYTDDFNAFYNKMISDMDSFEKFGIRSNRHPNTFIVSCVPWLSYSSFTTNNESDNMFLFPMVVWGKYFEQGDKILMPLTLQIHHAVADGYHCSLFYKDIEDIINTLEMY